MNVEPFLAQRLTINDITGVSELRAVGRHAVEETEIEPAEEVSDDDLTKKLAEMYSAEEATEEKTEEAPAEEEQPEEKPAPTSFNDMKSALDAIRARLKK